MRWGLRALAKRDETATAAGGYLLLAGMPQFVLRLLDIAGMDGHSPLQTIHAKDAEAQSYPIR